MVNYEGLIENLREHGEPFGLLTMQATSTTRRLMQAMPDKLKCLFSAEQGFFGTGDGTGAWHHFWNRPIHSICSQTKITDAMFEGIGRVVIDLCDIGVRCYPYLSTLKLALEECAKRGLPVTLLDRQIPLGGMLDGPMRKPAYASPLAPINVPFCHGMTPGECAEWIRRAEDLELDLTIIKLDGWSHADREPWANFIPPSDAISSWDSAATFPMTVFADACPSVDCGQGGALAYRVLGAPWMDQQGFVRDLAPGLASCGVGMRPYRYQPAQGRYRGQHLNGILFSITNAKAFYPVTAGMLVFTALIQRHGTKAIADMNAKLLDRLNGSNEIRETLDHGELGDLFQSWIDAQDEFLKTKVDLYCD